MSDLSHVIRRLPTPSPAVTRLEVYRVPRHPAEIDLTLDGNEGLRSPDSLLEWFRDGTSEELLRRYPHPHELERQLAKRHGIDPARVLVTSGGDDALDRACRALLTPHRSIVVPVPTFEMVHRYVCWTGAAALELPWWEGPYPVDAALRQVRADTVAIMVVSPNNPTGATATIDDLHRLAAEAPQCTLIVDLAYVEFAEHDLSAFVLELPNAILVRTLSKAWGLAALRVGYAAGDPTLIEWMRVVGSPYPVSGPSVHIAKKRLAADAHDVEKFVARVRNEREELRERLQTWGMSSTPSQGNFVFARSARAQWLSDALASQGIAVRTWPDHPLLGDAIRITTPGDEVDFARLLHGVEQALAPEAILFDMDGVLVDVSGSYREAIVQTAASFGVDLSHAEIAAAKAEGNANNDWIVTQRLLARRGSEVNLEAVTERFEDLYQGTLDRPGLWRHERCLISTELVERLRRRCKLAVVTGRPRRDAVAFVQRERLEQAFDAMVCMEDGPLKPDPFVIDETMRRLGVSRAWFVGDTVDDMTAARAAKLVGIGVGDPDGPHAHAMRSAGAAQILSDLEALEVLLR